MYVQLKGTVRKVTEESVLFRYRDGGTLLDRWIPLAQLENPDSVKEGDDRISLRREFALQAGFAS